MKTPERSIEEIDYQQLAKDLRIKSGMIAMGERIAWGSDSGIMDAAADAIEQLTQTLQTERQKRDDAVEEERERIVQIVMNTFRASSENYEALEKFRQALTQTNNPK